MLAALALNPVSEESRSVTTADGWRLALHRWRPAVVRFREPVVLSHGFIENRRIWDLDAEHSLARRLAERGFDVWAMELRGSGDSQAPPVSSVRGWTFSIDDFIRADAPAALRGVLEATGAEQALMVGHSLGGLLVYSTLEGPDASRVRAAVTLAGVGTMSGGDAVQARFDRFFKLLGLTLGPVLPGDAPFPMRWVLHAAFGKNDRAWAEFARRLDSPLGHPFWDESNMTPALVEALLREGVTDTALNVVRDFLRYARQGRVDGVTDRLGTIRTPLLAVAGAEDLVIPAADVRWVAARAGAQYVELPGIGHEDICVGLRAPALVYPLVGDWLERHATPRDTFAARSARISESVRNQTSSPFGRGSR